MDEIEQRARELLAAEFEKDGYHQTGGKARDGYWDDHPSIRAIIAALTPPEGYVLVPVEPTEEMLKVGYSWMMGRIVMRSLYDELLAARPEAT